MKRQRPDMRMEKNVLWKGEEASYYAKHIWASYNFGRPLQCEHCLKTVDSTRKIHWANISGQYKRERSDWLRLCVSCHRKYDYGRGAGHTRGETHLWAKLTEKQVREIRLKYEPKNYSLKRLAAEYGVAIATISCIITRRNWKHVN